MNAVKSLSDTISVTVTSPVLLLDIPYGQFSDRNALISIRFYGKYMATSSIAINRPCRLFFATMKINNLIKYVVIL